MTLVEFLTIALFIYVLGAFIAQIIIAKWFSEYYDWGAAAVWPLVLFLAILEWIYYKVVRNR